MVVARDVIAAITLGKTIFQFSLDSGPLGGLGGLFFISTVIKAPSISTVG